MTPRPGLRLFACLFLLVAAARAEKPLVLESAHYRVHYEKKYEAVAGEVIRQAEAVWPTLAKAYDAYGNYQVIDIYVKDQGDYANGYAIYNFSTVSIYVPHLNWVMRGRANWIGNVITHELSHVFSLREKARLWIFDDFTLGFHTFNRKVNWNFLLPWVPLPAPNWWIEGIAQFEAAEAGQDAWDSQRDMIIRDAFLTGTLPTLGEIETYDGDWLQGERVYNTGFCFLRYLRDRNGLETVRQLAVPKPFFHFGGAVQEVFGKSLSDLYEEWKKSLADRYADYRSFPRDTLLDPDIDGTFSQNLAFSPDGRFMAWLGNGDRDYALNWIYWKELGSSGVRHSARPAKESFFKDPNIAVSSGQETPNPGFKLPFMGFGVNPLLRLPRPSVPRLPARITDPPFTGRSEEISSAGLEFSHDGKRLLTTRSDRYSSYNDIWEYEFLSKKSEEEKWHRLTWNIRATSASYHPTGSSIVFSQFKDGSSNVSVLDSAGRIRQLTNFREGQQVYHPRYTPKGDSIYFALGVGKNEAIVAIAAESQGYDPFATLDDSAKFPDTLYAAKGQRVRFLTPLNPSGYRDLRFAGDTLIFSNNGSGGVYNVYARLLHDTTLYRLTQNRTQALEPLLRNGTLYYQGYERQHFRIFRQTARLDSVGPWPKASDTLTVARPKAKDYSKVLETGEPGERKVAWTISPFLDVAPQFLDDTTLSDLNLDLGLRVDLGPLSGGLSQSLFGYVAKRTDFSTPMDYGAAYEGNWSGIPAWHQRFSWTPNLGYGLERDVRHLNYNFLDQGLFISNVGATLLRGTLRTQIRLNYRDDMVYGYTDLPMSGHSLWGGYLQTFWYGRYWNRNITEDATQSFDLLDTTNNKRQTGSQDFHVMDASVHWHLFQTVALQWYTMAYATPLPRYFGFFADLGQWWARYALDAVPTDSISRAMMIQQSTPVVESQLPKSDFTPWQTNWGWFWSWSEGENFQISFVHQVGFFTHKFPTVTDTVAVDSFSNAFVDNPRPNLWVMSYRLGLGMMPAYPYNFFYRGHDILQGTAMSWAHLQMDFPVKIRKFIDYPSPFSSLNKLQLSLMGDAGTTLNRTPDQLVHSLENGEHHLLLDYGAKLSLTFLMYHWLPMELYFMTFMPYNQLRAGRLYYSDFGYNPASQKTEADQRREYLDYVKQRRYYVGLTIGGF